MQGQPVRGPLDYRIRYHPDTVNWNNWDGLLTLGVVAIPITTGYSRIPMRAIY